MHDLINKKLSLKILTAVLGITIISAAVSGIIYYSSQIKEINRKIPEVLELESLQISELLQTSMYTFDYVTVKSICKASFSDIHIFSITIEDTSLEDMNFTISRTDFESISDELLIKIDKSLIHTKQKIFYGEDYLGTIEISMAKYFFILEVKQQILSFLIQLLLSCLIMSVFLFVFLEGLFVKPLKKITHVTEVIADGALSSRISIKNKDELGILAHKINLMANTIEENISVLKSEILNRKEAEEQLKKNMDEKDLLIMEIHHRVKNNLTIVNSIMSLQAEKFKNNDIYEAFADISSIISSLALVHEQLYQNKDFSQINMREYIFELIDYLKSSYIDVSNLSFQTDIEDVQLNITQATPMGILLNELIVNVFKHAYKVKKTGDVWISFRKISEDEDLICLNVKDNGSGFSPDFNINTVNTAGLTIVRSLVEQLDGKLVVSENESSGSDVSITFCKS